MHVAISRYTQSSSLNPRQQHSNELVIYYFKLRYLVPLVKLLAYETFSLVS